VYQLKSVIINNYKAIQEYQMKTILVLAMHGAPPNDFPKDELSELMGLHHRLEHASGADQVELQRRYTVLNNKVCYWPRTPQNDPFYTGSIALAKQLEIASKLPVILGFNEFCAPSMDEALEQAASKAEVILVVTPMMTRGGEHSEKDIPASVRRAQELYPDMKIQYIWPFDSSDVARFLAAQVKRFQ
jgi:sirohydrochlorin cobaltochelatase